MVCFAKCGDRATDGDMRLRVSPPRTPVDNFRVQPVAIGRAVVNLICSIAKLDDTSVSGAVAISRR
jgi:hypothetical protein